MKKFKKLKFLIASGPTREPLDPVRYLSNYSTGTMGRFLVKAAKKKGHDVDWVECPHQAETAQDLLRTLKKRISKSDVFVMAAAVCDVRAAFISPSKIKKETLRSLILAKNPDVLASLGRLKKKDQVFVGFALESSHLLANARKKLNSKFLDLIVVQKVTQKVHPFGQRPIEAFVLDRQEIVKHFPLVNKARLASFLVGQAERLARWPSS